MKKNTPKTFESLASDAVQQNPLGTIKVGGVEYTIDRPRVRTIIEVSRLISFLPEVDIDAKGGKSITEALRVAKSCDTLGLIAATLILGAKHLTEQREISETVTKYHGLFKHTKKKTIVVDARKELADKLLLELDAGELKELITECLVHMKIGSFFSLITSLYGVNLLKPTGEAITTASGQ